jgi:hypothetical protein
MKPAFVKFSEDEKSSDEEEDKELIFKNSYKI